MYVRLKNFIHCESYGEKLNFSGAVMSTVQRVVASYLNQKVEID